MKEGRGVGGICQKICFVSVTTKIGILLLFSIVDVSFLNVYTTIPYSKHKYIFCVAVLCILDVSAPFFVRATQTKVGIYFVTVFCFFFKIFEVTGHIKSCESPRQTGTEQQGETTKKGSFRIEPKKKKNVNQDTLWGKHKTAGGGKGGGFFILAQKILRLSAMAEKVCCLHFL